jgi:hypothetical protein
LLDRIDIHVDVPLVDFKELTSDAVEGESYGGVADSLNLTETMKTTPNK